MAKTGTEVEMDVKSRNSLEAGIELMNRSFYTESIHCFYYSVLQLMMYKLAHQTNGAITYEKQMEKRQLYNTSTHHWLYSEVRNLVPRKGMQRDRFVNDFNFLKGERIQADYERMVFDADSSTECRGAAERLIANLKNIK